MLQVEQVTAESPTRIRCCFETCSKLFDGPHVHSMNACEGQSVDCLGVEI